MNITNLWDGYRKKIKNLDTELKKLKKESDAIAEAQDYVDEVSRRIVKAEREIAHLQSKRIELQEEYAAALFNQDDEALAEVINRRNDIDRQVSDYQAKVEGWRLDILANTPDAQEATELAVQLDLLTAPDATTFFKELQRLLYDERNTLEDARREARGKIPNVETDLYNDLMHEERPTHKSSTQRQLEKLARDQKLADDAKTYARLGGL